MTELRKRRNTLLLIGFLSVVGGGRAAAARGGKICIVRSQDEGSMNRHPVRVWGEQRGRSRRLVELRGGEKACVSVPLGRWSLEARSTRPYDPKASDANECRSFPLIVDVTKTEAVTVSVSPLGRGPTYVCGWDLG
jgi:hypothetical protein